MEELIGYISGIIIFISGLIYTYRVYKKDVVPNIVTWSLFSLMGIIIVLSYSASGAKENLIPAIAATLSPVLIVILSLFRKTEKKYGRTDVICGFIGVVSIIFWYITKESRELVQWALYLAILADIIAIIPTIEFVNKNPEKDRPGSWFIFSVGYALVFATITEHTFANYSLPLWMTFGSVFVWWPLIKYRIKNNIPIRKWI